MAKSKLKVESATLNLSNGNDSASPYQITGSIRLSGNNKSQVENGQIYRKEDGTFLCNFSEYDGGSNVSFYGNEMTDAQKVELLTAANGFIAKVKEGDIDSVTEILNNVTSTTNNQE